MVLSQSRHSCANTMLQSAVPPYHPYHQPAAQHPAMFAAPPRWQEPKVNPNPYGILDPRTSHNGFQMDQHSPPAVFPHFPQAVKPDPAGYNCAYSGGTQTEYNGNGSIFHNPYTPNSLGSFAPNPYLSMQTQTFAPFASQEQYSWISRTQQQPPKVPSGAGTNHIRVRTREKYRMVYNDFQRLELEKEFMFNKYITTNRKTELSQHLGLTERQIKIWFQNRRAKDRKSERKSSSVSTASVSPDTVPSPTQALNITFSSQEDTTPLAPL